LWIILSIAVKDYSSYCPARGQATAKREGIIGSEMDIVFGMRR
jgi:hypothetical protein